MKPDRTTSAQRASCPSISLTVRDFRDLLATRTLTSRKITPDCETRRRRGNNGLERGKTDTAEKKQRLDDPPALSTDILAARAVGHRARH